MIVIGSVLLILSMLLQPALSFGAVMKYDDPRQIIPVFYSQGDVVAWQAMVKGRILNIGQRKDTAKQELSRTVQPKTKVVVRLYNTDGIHKGSTLYVINTKNLIVSRFTVESIFRSKSFGDMLIGHGFFRLSTIGDRVVQRFQGEYPQFAKVHKARGDYYFNKGDFGNAIREYNEAIVLDKNFPEARLALGKIYFKDKVFQFAFNEFLNAYNNKDRMVDKQDLHELLYMMAKTRYIEVYELNAAQALRGRFLAEGIRYAKEALEIKQDDVELLYMLGKMYYKNPAPDDVAARDVFEKIIEHDPAHIGAFIGLSELYLKHKNRKKAHYYAGRALQIDPAHERARFIFRLTNENN